MAETKTTGNAEQAESSAPAEAKSQRRRVPRRKAVEEHTRSYFDAIISRDMDAMAAHWKEDGVADVVPLGMLRGREEIMGFFRELFAAVPDIAITVTKLVAGEREAAVEWRLSGEFSGTPFQGVEATGRAVELRGFDLLEVEDGKNLGTMVYYDGMSFARQVGMLPSQDSGTERAIKSAFNATTRLRRAVADRRATE